MQPYKNEVYSEEQFDYKMRIPYTYITNLITIPLRKNATINDNTNLKMNR